jgi:hypothetical protein
MLLTLGACKSQAGNAAWEYVLHEYMLMHFDDWSSVSVRQDVLHQQHLRMQVSHGLCRH